MELGGSARGAYAARSALVKSEAPLQPQKKKYHLHDHHFHIKNHLCEAHHHFHIKIKIIQHCKNNLKYGRDSIGLNIFEEYIC
jgi:hypothetical protein